MCLEHGQALLNPDPSVFGKVPISACCMLQIASPLATITAVSYECNETCENTALTRNFRGTFRVR